MKVLLIVLGSLFVLALVAIVGLALLVPKMLSSAANNGRNPAYQKRTAAKIADFTVPPGYRIAQATDLGISQTLVIRSTDPASAGFQIQLTGQTVPSNSSTAFGAMKATLGMAAKFTHCDLQEDKDDVYEVRGKPVAFKTLACAHGTPSMHVEIGDFAGTAPNVQVVVTGVGSFDRDAVRKLLGSVR